MSKTLPKVTIIVPITEDRRSWATHALTTCENQDYLDKEILFDWGQGTIGEKRNRLCKKAKGDIIVTIDSDDQYKPDWVTKSVAALILNEAEITGLRNLNFYKAETQEAWEYHCTENRPWVAGATMCYWKSFWEKQPFENIQIGEDAQFIWNRKEQPKVFAHDYQNGFLASVHDGNTSKRYTDNVFNYRPIIGKELVLLEKIWGYHRYGLY